MPRAAPPAQLGDQPCGAAGRRRAGAHRDLRYGLRIWPLARHRWPTTRIRGRALAGQPRAARRRGVGAPTRGRRRGAGVTLQERFNPERLIATACEEAGSDDFCGGPGFESWRTGLARVADGLVNEARLSAIGVEIAYLDLMRALKNRLDVIAWRKQHPEIASKPISQPIFIVGQPRSGN